MSAHVSFARSAKLRGHSAGSRHWARRALVLLLETAPGATGASLLRRQQAWILIAVRDNGATALPLQVPATTAPAPRPGRPGKARPAAPLADTLDRRSGRVLRKTAGDTCRSRAH